MPGFWDMTGGAALGFITPNYSRAALSKKPIPFIETLKRRYAKDTNWVCFGSYDSVYLLKEAVNKAKSINAESVIKALESIEITGVYGKLKYNDTHTCNYGWPYMDFPYAQFQLGGDLVVVYPEGVAKNTNPTKKFIPIRQLRK